MMYIMHVGVCVCVQFVVDMELIYDNCCAYNGEDSEYYELAEDMRKLFRSLVKVHIEGETPEGEDTDEMKGKRRRRDSRSPSACHTPQLTSESSSEEESEDGRRVHLVMWSHMHPYHMHTHYTLHTYVPSIDYTHHTLVNV